MNKNINEDAVVYIIDDDFEVRNALKWLIESVQLKVICFESAIDFLEQYDDQATGCIVTDIRMPMMSGLQLLERLHAGHNHLPIIVITGHGDVPMAVKAMKMGVVDFISKPFNDQYLLEQIQQAITKSRALKHIDHQASSTLDKLSKREKEVMNLIAEGKLNKQIAQDLHISVSTVEFHRARLMKKTGAKNLAQLIKIYLMIKEGEDTLKA